MELSNDFPDSPPGFPDWPRIIQTHGPLVWRTITRLVGNRQAAEDCYQETFIAALGVARRDQVRQWAGLLRRIATARALDHLRRQGKEKRALPGHEEADDVGGNHGNPIDAALSRELAQRLRAALTQLPACQAEVFCLRFLEEMTYEQIAQVMRLDANHVGVLLHRARQQLQTLLETNTPHGRPRPREVCHE
ncbi:MAG: sigma-70 family RNA polymerase sigma factor [Phycisphaeraceae bacterium]|nr:sigma-70 family RNA polymerase sigma factor [Phycisphaeraceae bacterium]